MDTEKSAYVFLTIFLHLTWGNRW